MKRDLTDPLIIDPYFLLKMYSKGIFPMGIDDLKTEKLSDFENNQIEKKIAWYSPDFRGIIPLDSFKIPHGMKKVLKNHSFKLKKNTNFENVIKACASTNDRDRKETWINDVIIASYTLLHRLGYAHSVETWQDDKLVGGLYGVSLGSAFFGESMFSLKSEASKVALVELVRILKKNKFQLLDTQWSTKHLKMFGCIEISKKEYLKMLNTALKTKALFN